MKTIKDLLTSKLKSPGYQDHTFSMNRRELVRLGLLAAGGAVVGLSPIERALAQQADYVPFLTFDLAGGASLPGNFLVGQKGGPEDLHANYRRHGWNPRDNDALDRTFGLPMSKKHSKMLEGMRATLPAEITRNENQTMVKMAAFCHFSLDDTNTNRASALTMIARAGSRGRIFRPGLGLMATASGGNAEAYLVDGSARPVAVKSNKDITRLTAFGAEFEQLPAKERAQIFARLKAAAATRPDLRATYEELSRNGLPNAALDVTRQAEIARVYGLNDSGDAALLQAGIAYNVIAGNTGPGAITFAGCDYHDQSQTTGDSKDLEIGQAIGRAIHVAYLLKRPLMFHILTDGGIYAPDSANFERKWIGDSNQSSLSVVGLFHPTRPVNMRRLQVGEYTKTGIVELNTVIGSGPEKVAVGVAANYLQLHGQLERLEEVSGTRIQTNELDQLLVFG